VLTAFYKHPIEIAANSVIASAIIFSLLGGSVQAGAWFNVFAAVGEYFYHANLRTPRWFGYFIQRPEHHSIHHQLDVHDLNYGNITWWDRLFATFKEPGNAESTGNLDTQQGWRVRNTLPLARNIGLSNFVT
jgi:sterol desaturase/sphingolipid hydroxylase (fatty acid hydroxylase superfamily)